MLDKNKIQKIKRQITNFFSIEPEQKNAKRLLKRSHFPRTSGIILVEAHQSAWNQLALSLFLTEACRKFDAYPVNYYLRRNGVLTSWKERIRQFFSVAHSYGIFKFDIIGPNNYRLKMKILQAKEFAQTFNSKSDFELFEYRNVRIGDLVYDQYLRAAKQPTIDFHDELFELKLAEALAFVDELLTYFNKNKVKAVCVSHTVYCLAIPVRVALVKNVPAFQVNGEHIYRLSRQNTHSFTDFKYYPEEFKKLDNLKREEGLIEAGKRLNRRFSGEIGVDMPYSTASAYSPTRDQSFALSKNPGIHVLVAVHDFFDSPHSYGDNLFPDFLEWLNFLAVIARKTKYNWYIKTHPDVVGDGEEILRLFIESNPMFTLIPKEVSHHQLIKDGVTVVLTIFGTIASEYSYLGRLAVNASVNNPHVAYNFSLSPKSVNEYKEILFNLESISRTFKANLEEIQEFYFMHHINKMKTWMFRDLFIASKDLGGYSKLIDWGVIGYFFNSQNSFTESEVRSAIRTFLESSDFVLNRWHFNSDNSVQP